jgi:nitroreductase
MDFTEVVLKRRMVRQFTDEPVDIETIDQLVELARHAPSAGFTQGQAFVIVTDPQMRKQVARLCGEEEYDTGGFGLWISQAPVQVVPCTSEAAYHRRYNEPDKKGPGEEEIEWPVPYWHMDVGCAVMVLLLAVVNEGLAAGFAGAFDLDGLRSLLGIPAEWTPVGVIPIGHPAPDKRSPSLKRGRVADEIYLHHEGW